MSAIISKSPGFRDEVLLSLLLQIRLNTPLPRLALIVLPLRLRLLRLVPRQPRDGAANRATNTILHALAQIAHLSLSLLALALLVLANALLLQALGAGEATDRLLQGANVLVPAAGGAVGVVFCDAAGRGGCVGTGFCGGVGEILLGGRFGLAVLALGLEVVSILGRDREVEGGGVPCQRCCRSGCRGRSGLRQWPGRGSSEPRRTGPCWST